MPDVRGLFRFYEELALRFAEHGYDAIAIDYFGRTAGVGKREEEFTFAEHIAQTKLGYLTQDVAAAVRELRVGAGSERRPVFTVGFCFGGSNSWLQAAGGHGLNGAIGFYGHPTRAGRDGSPPAVDRVTEFECPILALMGGDDPAIPPEEVKRYEESLTAAGIENEVQIYQGAPHSFFDRRHEEHGEASADAWSACSPSSRRTRRHPPTPGGRSTSRRSRAPPKEGHGVRDGIPEHEGVALGVVVGDVRREHDLLAAPERMMAGSGSGSKTSRPAAPRCPESSASTSASVSTTSPREPLTRIAPRFMRASCSRPINPRVSLEEATWSDTASELESSSSNST